MGMKNNMIIRINVDDKLETYYFDQNICIGNLQFIKDNNTIHLLYEDNDVVVECNEIINFNNKQIIILDNNHKKFILKDKVYFGSNGDVICNPKFILEDKTIKIIKANNVFLNYKKVDDIEFKIDYCDDIQIDDLVFSINKDVINLYCGYQTVYLEQIYSNDNKTIDFPKYYRSARIIKSVPKKTIKIDKPKNKSQIKKESILWMIMPPLLTSLVTVGASFFMGRGPFVIIMIATTIVTTVFSIVKFFKEKRELNITNKLREENWYKYIILKIEELEEAKNQLVNSINFNTPKIGDIISMIEGYNSRIYEKELHDEDFLEVKLGYAIQDTPYKIDFNEDLLEVNKDSLEEQAKEIYNHYRQIENTPITIDLKVESVGLVGSEKVINMQLHNLITQLVFFHSYHDLSIMFLGRKKDYKEFGYLKNYRHFYLSDLNIITNAFSIDNKLKNLNALYNIIKERIKLKQENKNVGFDHHILLVVKDLNDIINHSIMQYLDKLIDINVSIVVCSSNISSLPQFINTIELYEDSNHGLLIIQKDEEKNLEHKLEIITDVNFDYISRKLAKLDHKLITSTSIPNNVTILDLYNATTIDDLNIANRWSKSQISKSMSVPIGIKAENQIVELNLHENFHGPHGLVAGTTGSGKSETLQTFLLSLAINFSPEDIGFLIIDFKGGGMGNLFANIPHLLGTITNLDGDDIMRNLDSVNAEVTRRQEIFNNVGVNNINLYTEMYKKGEVKEPLPHLIVVSDEFAELKKQHPQFMEQLVSIARIGRTLGIHLILATQKPSGVVDDQIWSNSKFKLALKVQDESDSNEILKTPDASRITQTGRAYLQVGNNEIYELFQSGYSAAVYNQKFNDDLDYDRRIYLVDNIGQKQLVNDINQVQEEGISQLDAIINEIVDVYNRGDFKPVKKTWLPPLSDNLCIHYDNIDINNIDEVNLKISLGMMDLPLKQSQKEYIIDFDTDGNIAIFSSSGYGKSTTIMNILLQLANNNNPNLLNYYIIDLGTSGLIPLSDLPHCVDYISYDTFDDKFRKLVRLLNKEINRRKDLLSQLKVSNISIYNKMVEEKLDYKFVVIDNYDVFVESYEEYDDTILKLTRDGNSVGIYTILGITRQQSLRPKISANIKTKIVQYMFNNSDVVDIIGNNRFTLPENIKGRAIVKDNDYCIMQVYKPVEGNNYQEYNKNLKDQIDNIVNKYQGEKLLSLPVMPNELMYSNMNLFDYADKKGIVLGLNIDDVEKEVLIDEISSFSIIGPAKCGKTNVLEVILDQVEDAYIIDSRRMTLFKYRDKFNYTTNEPQEFLNFVDVLVSIVNERKEAMEKSLLNNEFLIPDDFYESLENKYLIIDDAQTFCELMDQIVDHDQLLYDLNQVGFKIIVTIDSGRFSGLNSSFNFIKNIPNYLIIKSNGYLSFIEQNVKLESYKAYLHTEYADKIINLPKFDKDIYD